jgi:lipoate-protein ligase A
LEGAVFMNEVIIYKSFSYDPWFNLAVEDLLLDMVDEYQYVLFLWRNRDTIMIGKNQNPWKECRPGMLEEEGGYLARRLSGGGAVFNDLGNLNFTFLMSRANYNRAKQTGIVLKAVQNFGIAAEQTERNDLTVNGRKFSGNTFCFRTNSACHHGTILIASDLEKMAKYLQAPEDKISSKGIDPVRSRVVNLNEYAPSLTVEALMDRLCYEFAKVYRRNPSEWRTKVKSIAELDQVKIRDLYRKYASWEWRYGEDTKFDLEIATRFPWGGVEIGLKLVQGVIRKAAVYSDALDAEFIEKLPEMLLGLRLNGSLLAQGLSSSDLGPDRRQMQLDVARWVLRKQF